MSNYKGRHLKGELVQKTVRLGAILSIYLGIPSLILAGVIPWGMKFVALVAGTVFMYLLARILGEANADLGLTWLKARDSLLAVAPLTLALIAASIIFLVANGARFYPTEGLGFFVFYIFVSCPAQELLFRGILANFLSTFKFGQHLEAVIASLLFGFVHIIYRDALTVVVMTIVGLFWYRAYKKASSLLGVTVSHIILGVLTIAVGLVD